MVSSPSFLYSSTKATVPPNFVDIIWRLIDSKQTSTIVTVYYGCHCILWGMFKANKSSVGGDTARTRRQYVWNAINCLTVSRYDR